MARPRKDSDRLEARLRIIEAFWTLLEDHEVNEITVGNIVDCAECNRGSFYYHYVDIPDLADAAIENELTGENNLPGRFFVLVTGAGSMEDVLQGQGPSIHRLSLAMERGGYDRVNGRIVEYIEKMWTKVLCDDGDELTEASRFVITYATGALLNVFRRYGDSFHSAAAVEGMFLGEAGGVVVRNLCSAQNKSIDDVLVRLRSLRGFLRMPATRRSRVR